MRSWRSWACWCRFPDDIDGNVISGEGSSPGGAPPRWASSCHDLTMPLTVPLGICKHVFDMDPACMRTA